MSSASAAADRHGLESGLGSITWWGFSPALDLQAAWLESQQRLPSGGGDGGDGDGGDGDGGDGPDALNILIVGSGDQRHLLTTLARRRRHGAGGRRPLRLFVLETDCSLYCRACLQLALCLDRRASVQERAELFLELYGNALVREQTVEYVTALCPALIRLVTDPEHCGHAMPLLDLGELKFRERDAMEAVFKFWRLGLADRRGFDAQLCWDLRLRQHLGVRYDAIPNVFDWDHQMTLVERPFGALVSRPEYLHWRAKGVAFRLRDGAYDASNRTLCSAALLSAAGERHARRGYWGDIVCSPYLGWGLRSEWPEYASTANGQHVNSVGAVCEYNVCSVMHELRTGLRYRSGAAADGEAAADDDDGAAAAAADDGAAAEAEGAAAAPKDESGEPDFLPIDDVTVTFLPLGSLPTLANRAKYRGRFQAVYFSSSTVHLMAEQGVAGLLADAALVVVESALYMLELRMEQVALFSEKVADLAANLGATPLRAADPAKDDHFLFVKRSQ